MASGGYSNKQAKSETKRRSNWQRSVSSDRDDVQSVNSFPSDMRINNWDLSDLRPTNLSVDTKRRKKSKGNPEREREQSLSMDSPPHCEGKQHTPSSYPRTKLTPATSSTQRVALENLKQHMTFSDLDDQISTDGERNNERQVSSRRRLHNAPLNRNDSEIETRGARDRRVNRNNNMDYSSTQEPPSRNEVVARLMQIRDFKKQARAMLESMEKLGERKKSEDVEKVRILMKNLQEQEQGYKGLLQTLKVQKDDADDFNEEKDEISVKIDQMEDSDDSSVDLDVKSQNSESSDNSEDTRPRIESKLGLGSEDDDDNFADVLRGALGSIGNSNSNRTMDGIESALGNHTFSLPGVPIQETEEGASGPAQIDDEGMTAHHQELLNILRDKQMQLKLLMDRQEELNFKRSETEKKLLEAQARDNKASAALKMASQGKQLLQKQLANRDGEGDPGDCEEMEGAVGGGDNGVLKSNIVGYPESDDDDNSNVREVESTVLPNELLELKRQLNFLRNEFSQAKEAQKNVQYEQSTEEASMREDQQQLQNKLLELQNKKTRMDKLLQELQVLHQQPLSRNNESNPLLSQTLGQQVVPNIPSSSGAMPKQRPLQPPRSDSRSLPAPTDGGSSMPSNIQDRLNDVAATAPGAIENAMQTFAQLTQQMGTGENNNIDSETYAEVHEKLRRLKEVRGQLDQLRGLVQYYQTEKMDMETRGGDDRSSLPGFSDNGEPALLNAQSSMDTKESSLAQQPQLRQPNKQLGQLMQQQEQLLQQQLNQQLQQQQKVKRSDHANPSAIGAPSLHNMAQLLNLAADQGDEHSDEDNASVSQSDSQWSHLGPWDDDPEIQEKVKKLKAAKEKLRQLQDLVAFVQQSPDTARALPELGDLAASMADEAVSQATQTDEPNVSVSEGEVPIGSQERDEASCLEGLENPRAELERLRKERTRLMELQTQLKQMHDVIERSADEQDARSEQNTDTPMGKPVLEQAPNATVVTFASNDELYSKMRRQRILREELRSKKRELEAIMKKDRNKKQYSRNQDNQSDTVSLNTDAFGIPGSVDATMATWGGSTVDNLENITEDEDGQERNEGDDHDEDDDDDGYPSDGIVQVEEEEEENDSDNGTYTIEADARQRKSLRKGNGLGVGARPKTSRGQRQTFPQPSYSDRNTKKPERKTTNKKCQRRNRITKQRQENYRSAEDIMMQDDSDKGKNENWFRVIEDRLSNLSGSVEALLRKSDSENRQLSVSLSQENSPQTGNMMNPVQEQMLQLQNQSMMLSFGQLVQSLARQQVEMQQMQQQMQHLQIQVQESQGDHSMSTSHMLRPSLSATALNNSNYNLQTAAIGSQPISLSRQQAALNNTAPAGFNHSPGLRASQPSGFSPGNLSLAGQSGVPNHLGTGLSVNTGSPSSLPLQNPGSGFVFNPLGQSTLSMTGQQHSTQTTSASTMTQDLSQFVNSGPHSDPLAQFSNMFGSNNQQSSDGFNFFSGFRNGEDRGEEAERNIENVSPVLRMNPYAKPEFRKSGTKRKQPSKVVKSESDPTSGICMSTPKVENTSARGHDRKRLSQQRGVSMDAATYNSILAEPDVNTDFHQASSFSNVQDTTEITNAKSTDTNDDSNSLFENMRETIYSEVASLISQNQSRPQFLLELFRDMRHIDSDVMRQRTLNSIENVIGTNTNQNSVSSSNTPTWLKTCNNGDTANSEQTPSESVCSSEEDDELQIARLQEQITKAERNRLNRHRELGALQRNFPFDYAENADHTSSLSTPTNGAEDSPFFQDALGETVIGFENLRQKDGNPKQTSKGRGAKREMSRKQLDRLAGAKPKLWGESGFLASDQLLRDMKQTTGGEEERRGHTSEVSSSAMDQASESSCSDVPYPRIDMKDLDRQIKEIMLETIPVVKMHMEDVCSPHLLAYVKGLVLALTTQTGSPEFARFFQRQLASILQDTLKKYEGRKMRECGEDLLVEMSDVLFNELAFFKLMQDLDDPNVAGKMRAAEWPDQASQEKDELDNYSVNSPSSTEEEENEEDHPFSRTGLTKAQQSFRITEAEQDVLGRERDDEMANEVVQDSEEKDDDDPEQSYKIELAPSETKPFTRIGSDEDDDDEDSDEEQSMEDPSETAVSRDAMLENGVANIANLVRPETEGAHGSAVDAPQQVNNGTEKQDQEKPVVNSSDLSPSKMNRDVEGAANAILVNGSMNGRSTDDLDGEELTLDDLPERLTLPPALQNNTSSDTPNTD